MLLTEQHEQLRNSVERFVEREINPFVDEWEKAEEFPSHTLFKKLGALGLLGVKYDEAYGGLGLDFSYSAVVAEALGNCACGGVPMAIGVQSDMATPALHRFGSDELKRNWLVPTIAGDMVACLGVSEPGGGSDVAAIKTAARKDGGDYVISGSKMWITNGLKADWCCLLANTSEGKVHRNKSLIVVPMDAKGIERQKIRKLGMFSSDTAQLFFDEVRVPRANVIGQEGMGFTLQCCNSRRSGFGPARIRSPCSTGSSMRPSITRASARRSANPCSTTKLCISALPSFAPRWRRCARSSGAPSRTM